MRPVSESDVIRREMRVGVLSFFISVAALAGLAMLVAFSVLQAPGEPGNKKAASNGHEVAQGIVR
jgi:hypothetical protein